VGVIIGKPGVTVTMENEISEMDLFAVKFGDNGE
jgi:hypothetical protein